nr:hypothetical protein Iba_chr13aCG14050 [Ipomoea batatas]
MAANNQKLVTVFFMFMVVFSSMHDVYVHADSDIFGGWLKKVEDNIKPIQFHSRKLKPVKPIDARAFHANKMKADSIIFGD